MPFDLFLKKGKLMTCHCHWFLSLTLQAATRVTPVHASTPVNWKITAEKLLNQSCKIATLLKFQKKIHEACMPWATKRYCFEASTLTVHSRRFLSAQMLILSFSSIALSIANSKLITQSLSNSLTKSTVANGIYPLLQRWNIPLFAIRICTLCCTQSFQASRNRSRSHW